MGRPAKGESALSERLDIRFTAEDKAALERLAAQRSTPQRKISAADLVRQCVGTFLAVARPRGS